ncbi:hypothetical protein GCM10023196_060130 [Actinoallomurus vinaceus]|uniref:Uncharacterized protein n=1 Tax=Actinoallomurus vinaceus TaxID=1080074 RepID=A0ABP8UHP0_9ACTN
MSGPEPRDAERIEGRPGVAERCYRRLLRTYPPAYRAAHGEEFVGTLLEVSAGRGRPSVRESAGLVRGGLAARLRERTAHPTPWWADGLALGAFLIALSNLVADLGSLDGGVGNAAWLACSLVLVGALFRGRFQVALTVTLLQVLQLICPLIGADDLTGGLLPLFGPVNGGVMDLMGYAPMAVALTVLVVRRPSRPRSRSWWWAAGAVVLSAAWHVQVPWAAHRETICTADDICQRVWVVNRVELYGDVYLALMVLLLSCGIWVTAVTRDLRWSLAAAFFLLASAVPYVALTMTSAIGAMLIPIALWAVQAVMVAAMVVTARRGVRARA